ncbi:hypothetical protein NDU88_007573 [Pleurodeles waltl]|uniref:Uncharacterized protein n=1 Tax=Pleurodeles waltl TaxID=8319 RepID=A0AAV7NX08_PLEWA|nr:hypothetical protein NDU88_007573 [Pleurodeles waltl]
MWSPSEIPHHLTQQQEPGGKVRTDSWWAEGEKPTVMKSFSPQEQEGGVALRPTDWIREKAGTITKSTDEREKDAKAKDRREGELDTDASLQEQEEGGEWDSASQAKTIAEEFHPHGNPGNLEVDTDV